MSPALGAAAVEAAFMLRRLARRREVRLLALLNLGVLVLGGFPGTPRSVEWALAATVLLGQLNVLALSSGIVSDDLEGRQLVIIGSHPPSRGVIVVGRWLAVVALVSLVVVLALPLVVFRAHEGAASAPGALLGAWVAGWLHLVALAAFAVACSALGRPAAQGLALAAVVVLGAVPPEWLAARFDAEWALEAARGLWLALPTPWVLGRLQDWALGTGPAVPLAAATLLAQAPALLAIAGRRLTSIELSCPAD